MTKNTLEEKAITFDGARDDAGQITFRRLPDGNIEIEIFQQDTLTETITPKDKHTLLWWLAGLGLDD